MKQKHNKMHPEQNRSNRRTGDFEESLFENTELGEKKKEEEHRKLMGNMAYY